LKELVPQHESKMNKALISLQLTCFLLQDTVAPVANMGGGDKMGSTPGLPQHNYTQISNPSSIPQHTAVAGAGGNASIVNVAVPSVNTTRETAHRRVEEEAQQISPTMAPGRKVRQTIQASVEKWQNQQRGAQPPPIFRYSSDVYSRMNMSYRNYESDARMMQLFLADNAAIQQSQPEAEWLQDPSWICPPAQQSGAYFRDLFEHADRNHQWYPPACYHLSWLGGAIAMNLRDVAFFPVPRTRANGVVQRTREETVEREIDWLAVAASGYPGDYVDGYIAQEEPSAWKVGGAAGEDTSEEGECMDLG